MDEIDIGGQRGLIFTISQELVFYTLFFFAVTLRWDEAQFEDAEGL